MPPPDNDFELIPWDDWMHHYWMPTISQYEPIVFIKACKHAHSGHEHLQEQLEGERDLFTAFVQGVDGNTYKLIRRASGVIEQVPIYTMKPGA